MNRPRHRLPLVLAAAALAVAGVLVAAGGAGSARRPVAVASAFERDSSSSRPRAHVRVSGDRSRSTRTTSVRGTISGRQASAGAGARSSGVRIFGGLVTARGVRVGVRAADGRVSRSGRIAGLRVNGRRRGSPTSPHRYSMGGRGTLHVLQARGSGIVGLRAVLSRSYRGHPAGSVVTVGSASARARDGSAPRRRRDRGGERERGREGDAGSKRRARAGGAKRRKAPRLRRLQTSRGFVFPVYGKSRFSNDWGAPRAITGSHQGNDIFAPAGAPVLAVTDGELFRVGTRPVPGNRTWLMSEDGDSFFYAHLSAFAHDARNGATVKAGDVIGFVGSTGDAEQTPPHLHFEVHPDNDDAVNPYPFLRAWQDRRDVPRAAWLTRYGADPGSRPGALVVLEDYLER